MNNPVSRIRTWLFIFFPQKDTIFKNQNLIVAGGVPKNLSVRRIAKFRKGGICWVCGHPMAGGCNEAAGPKRSAHNAMLARHRASAVHVKGAKCVLLSCLCCQCF